MNMRNFVRTYVSVGIGFAIVSASVLIKDSKDTPFQIAYYATANGVMWPIAIVAMVNKKKSLKLVK